MSASSTDVVFEAENMLLNFSGLHHDVGVFDLRRRFFPVLQPILAI
jgi:hypothetical protein